MRELVIPYTTSEYIKVPLTAWSGTVADPTTLTVELAVITPGAVPQSGDWKTATWVTESSVIKARALWSTLVPSAAPSTTYGTWMRITASPEQPVIYSGPIKTL